MNLSLKKKKLKQLEESLSREYYRGASYFNPPGHKETIIKLEKEIKQLKKELK